MKYQEQVRIKKELKENKTAVKKKCYDCMGGMKKIDCEIPRCSLYPFRPFKK